MKKQFNIGSECWFSDSILLNNTVEQISISLQTDDEDYICDDFELSWVQFSSGGNEKPALNLEMFDAAFKALKLIPELFEFLSNVSPDEHVSPQIIIDLLTNLGFEDKTARHIDPNTSEEQIKFEKIIISKKQSAKKDKKGFYLCDKVQLAWEVYSSK